MYSKNRRAELIAFDNEREANRGKDLHKITISSHVQSKWRFVDLETGEIWKLVNGDFKPDYSGRIKIKELK